MPIPVEHKPIEDMIAQQRPKDDKPSMKPAEFKLERSSVKYADVAGLQSIKEKINDSIGLAMQRKDLFEYYRKERRFGAVLYGPPGCGKTFIIKAIGGELGIPLIIAGLSEILSSYTGETEKNISRLFKAAQENAPCIIVIDEFDSLGLSKDQSKGDMNRVAQNAVNQLLTEMDGLSANRQDVFVIATTNKPWDIESSLLRKGRFGELIYVPAPAFKERLSMFKLYTRIDEKEPTSINYNRLARATIGYSSSDIKDMCDQAKQVLIKTAAQKKKRKFTTSLLLRIMLTKQYRHPNITQWYVTTAYKNLQNMLDEEIKQYADLSSDIKRIKKDRWIRRIIRFSAFVI